MSNRMKVLQVKIVPPDDWMLDETLRSAGVRVKIENGVIFLKPSGIGIHDIIELEFRRKAWWGTLVMPSQRRGLSLSERIHRKLERLGFTGRNSCYFELTAAQRGWHSISLPGHRTMIPPPSLAVRKITMHHAIMHDDQAPAAVMHQVPAAARCFSSTITAADVEWVLDH